MAGSATTSRPLPTSTKPSTASPDDPRVHVAYGHALLGHGDDAGALAAFTEAIRLEPGTAANWYYRGNTHAAGERSRKPSPTSPRPSAASPTCPRPWYHRGNANGERLPGRAPSSILPKRCARDRTRRPRLNSRANVRAGRRRGRNRLGPCRLPAPRWPPTRPWPPPTSTAATSTLPAASSALGHGRLHRSIASQSRTTCHRAPTAAASTYCSAITRPPSKTTWRPCVSSPTTRGLYHNNLAWLWATCPPGRVLRPRPGRRIRPSRQRAFRLDGLRPPRHPGRGPGRLRPLRGSGQAQAQAVELAPANARDSYRERLAVLQRPANRTPKNEKEAPC